MTVVTNMGAPTIEALSGRAPCATTSLVHVARSGYYNDGSCHRLSNLDTFALECGDPAGKQTADLDYYFRDENLAGASYNAGTVAMSKVPLGRNGSQFVISFADPQIPMPESWTAFGTVLRGRNALKEIGAAETQDGSTDGTPKKPVITESVTVS